MSDEGTPAWRASFRALNVAQMLGAFNDNLFKGVILLLAGSESTRGLLAETDAFTIGGAEPKAMVGFIFALPFVLLGSFSGALADRFPKPLLIVRLKLTEIALMAVGTYFLWHASSAGLFVLLLLMATQSAFFGPNKYGVLPEMLPERQLSQANATIQATTYVGIIAGAWLSGELIGLLGPRFWYVGWMCVLVAGVGWFASRGVRPLPAARPDRALLEFPVAGFVRNLRRAARDRELLIALVLGALFLHVGGLVVIAAVAFGDWLGLLPEEIGRLNGVLAVGIGAGSVLSGKLSGERIRPGLVPIGAGGVAVFLGLLVTPGIGWLGAGVLFFLAGASAGFFVVPVRALIQERPATDRKGETVGLAQVLDFIALLLASVVFHVLSETLSMDAPTVMLMIGVLTAVGAGGLCACSRLYLPRWLRPLGRRDAD